MTNLGRPNTILIQSAAVVARFVGCPPLSAVVTAPSANPLFSRSRSSSAPPHSRQRRQLIVLPAGSARFLEEGVARVSGAIGAPLAVGGFLLRRAAPIRRLKKRFK